MKTVTEKELDSLLEMSTLLAGGVVFQFRYDEKVFQIQIKKDSQLFWVHFSMKPGVPYFFISSNRIFLVKNKKKPLPLFFKTHFLGLTFEQMERWVAKGRVLRLVFDGAEEKAEIHLSLVPGRVNIELQRGEKSVFAFKPKELAKKVEVEDIQQDFQNLRSHDFFEKLWQSQSVPEEGEKDLKKRILKKKQGLVTMEEKLAEQKKDHWAQLGNWLKSQQSLENVPEELKKHVNLEHSLSWNIENSFTMSKKNQGKVIGTLERIEQLKREIMILEKGEILKASQSKIPNLLAVADVKGRTIDLAEGRLFIGKSGKENLALLRKAKPWYLWLHIKDYPGAYGIIEKNKGKELSIKSLETAAQAVVKQSLPKGQEGAFDVLYTECRYVRPIKGAKSGQVTHSRERVLRIKVGV